MLEALGVNTERVSTWQSCNFEVNGAFRNDWMKDFGQLVPDILGNGTRVMIYAGDVDFICNCKFRAPVPSVPGPGRAPSALISFASTVCS